LAGKNLKKAEGKNSNQLLNPVEIAKPIVSEQAKLKGVDLNEVFEYDIPTKAGKTYLFKNNKH